ncbi:MAG: bL21 family ribosomal protein, partial [Planctomycetota bacterium]|nr:bL21 family ribosomal protein [Planctomycetota bacterium]
MYAIVEDSGTQIRVAEGDEFEIDLREGAEAGSEIVFDRVLLISSGEGEPTIGLHYVEGAS